jgi:hypothetical protein
MRTQNPVDCSSKHSEVRPDSKALESTKKLIEGENQLIKSKHSSNMDVASNC